MSVPATTSASPSSAPQLVSPRKTMPRSSRGTGDLHALTSNRIEIGHEMNSEILLCSLETFQNAYLPFVPTEQDITTCVEELIKTHVLKRSTNALHWAGFSKPPSQEDRAEIKVFSALEKIAKEVAKHKFPTTSHRGPPRISYQDCPDTKVASEVGGSNFRIDGRFRLKKNVSKLFTRAPLAGVFAPDTVVVAEFKKYSRDVVDNRLKVASAASHIMNDDPRRVFMFGITIEDNMMSLWYFSRSHSAKSQSFDFLQNPKLLVSAFLSFLFGTEEELGYDPAIRRYNKTPIYYEYEITGEGVKRYYRTCGALSSYRSLGITGRMTRVWRAVQISNFNGKLLPGKEVALKDVWLDQNARSERSIQGEIFAAVDSECQKHQENQESRLSLIQSFKSAGESWFDLIRKGEYKRFFLEINFDGQGVTTKDTPPGAEATLKLFEPATKDTESRSQRIPGADLTRSAGSGVRPAHLKINAIIESEVHQNRRYLPKRRYFLIYNDVCTTLGDAPDLNTTFLVLGDALIALAAMFVANWVHRDVSSENILFTGQGMQVQGKLGDLEYAKPFLSRLHHSPDPKTGTPYFMANELLSNRLLHVIKTTDETTTDTVAFSYIERRRAGESATHLRPSSSSAPRPLTSPPDPIAYNFQHDLESLWWIALWVLLARVAHEASQNLAKLIYINQLRCSEERAKVFSTPNHLAYLLDLNLHPSLPRSFVDNLDRCRRFLVSTCLSREEEERMDDAKAYQAIYPAVAIAFANCFEVADRLENPPRLISTRPRPPRPPPVAEASDPESTAGEIPSATVSNPRKRKPSTDPGPSGSTSKVARIRK